jgi:hypothetical protein
MSAERRGLYAERVIQARERLAQVDKELAELGDVLASPTTERFMASDELRALLAAVGRELLDLSTALGASTGQLRAR